MGAKRIATPTKMGDHHLVCGADFSNDSQRALVAVLSVGNGHEYLKLINSTYDLRSEADFFIGRAGDYYELDAIQLGELDAALSRERA